MASDKEKRWEQAGALLAELVAKWPQTHGTTEQAKTVTAFIKRFGIRVGWTFSRIDFPDISDVALNDDYSCTKKKAHMNGQPRLSFDTSAVNAIADLANRPESKGECAALLAGIRSGYFTRLTFPSVEEPLAASDEARRSHLFAILNKLRFNGECLQAHNWIATQLIRNYEKYGISRWDGLDLRFAECEIAIARREISQTLSDEQRQFAIAAEEEFKGVFENARPALQQVFADGTARPKNADELLAALNGRGGAFWNGGAGMYERVAGHRPTEEQVRAFAADCPPFMALQLGLVHAQYDWSITDKQVKRDKRVGRLDMFSAIYLPYCDIYITNDAEQRRCLSEIAVAASLPVEVLSLASFGSRLLVCV